MRPSALLTQLVLASSAHAFFPYSPNWRSDVGQKRMGRSIKSVGSGGSVRMDIKQRTPQSSRPISERAAREAARLAAKYTGGNVPNDNGLIKRDNEYSVMEATESTKDYTQGIDQDGTDYSYFIEVGVGSKEKPMYMLVDTGAGSSWVMGTSCTSRACSMHNTFGPDDSDSIETSDKAFSIAYGSGKVSGKMANDTMTVAGMTLKYPFGLADTTSDQFIEFPFDGILGLSISKGGDNFLNALKQADEIDKIMFCVALNRASDGTNEGEISFGSPNSDKYTGKISYTSIGQDNDWSIEMDDMGYNGEKAGVGGIASFIDTGTTYMFGPPDNVKKIHALIEGAQSSDDGTTFTVPCDSSGNLTLTFSGVDYVISPKDWVSPPNKEGECTSNIYGFEVVKGAWLLGDTFLKNVYTVFDVDGRRIGFANSAIAGGSGDDESSATKTKSSSEPSSTSEDSEETTFSAPDSTSTSGPDLGLGRESASTSTASADSPDSTETQDSAAPSGLLSQARSTFIFCIVPFFALLA
ncbi:hypothetical protein F66182_2924 [Fusarium sp. NRRL 66182]|nr:hypothetical protein F66182_2924 [Fusarium sp. NRRL 66182]